MTLEDRQNQLQSRIAAIDTEIGQIDNAFTELAASFSGIDGKETMRQCSELETRLSALRREKALVIAAQGHVTREQLHAKERQAEDDRRAVRADAKRIADALATLHAEIDDALVALRQLLERRMALLRELQATGIADSVVVKLQGKGPVNRALAAAGLHRFIDISTPAPGSFLPLRNAHPLLSGIGKLNGGGGHD
jgi:septal ring factor EnvC (AmiA/AmiB activator)